MKTILFITGSWPPMACGVGYYSDAWLKHFTHSSWQVTLMTAAPTDQAANGFEVLKPQGWRLRDLISLLSLCRQAQPDVVHLQYPAKGYGRQLGINLLPWLIRLLMRRSKLVITLHEYFGSPLLGRLRDVITALPAQHIILSNEADRRHLPRLARRKSIVIPLASNIESNAPDYQAARQLAGPRQRHESGNVLYYGFPFPSKRLEDLIVAMELTPGKDLLISAHLRHDDTYEASLLQQIQTRNSRADREQVRVIGFQPDDVLVALISTSFCFVLPQQVPANTKSSTVVSAIRYGIPIIGKAGEVWENDPLKHNMNALLLTDMNPRTIAETINRLVEDKVLYGTLLTNMARISAQYDWQVVLQRHYDVYETVVTGNVR